MRFTEAKLEMSAQVDLPRKPNEMEKSEEAEARKNYFVNQNSNQRCVDHFFLKHHCLSFFISNFKLGDVL